MDWRILKHFDYVQCQHVHMVTHFKFDNLQRKFFLAVSNACWTGCLFKYIFSCLDGDSVAFFDAALDYLHIWLPLVAALEHSYAMLSLACSLIHDKFNYKIVRIEYLGVLIIYFGGMWCLK